MDTRRMVLLSLFVAMAAVLHVVETWIPIPLPVPGAKLGLANIIAVLTIALYGWRAALSVAVLRVLLGSLLGGTLLGPAFAMSLCGALLSTGIMAYGYRHWQPRFSIVGISVIGAATHNLAQIVVAALLVVSPGLLWYLPYLLLFAIPTGLGTGLVACYLLPKVPQWF